MRTHWWVAAVVLLGVLRPAPASACDFRLAYGPLGAQSSRVVLDTTVQVFPFEETVDTGFTPSLNVGVRLSERLVVAPALGYCSYGHEQHLIVGTGVAVDILGSEGRSVRLQGHVARVDYGDVSITVLPVLAAASFDLGEGAAFQVGAGIRTARLAFVEATTSSNLTGFASVTVPVGGISFSVGAVFLEGKDPYDAFVVQGNDPSYVVTAFGDRKGESTSLGATIHLPLG